TAVFDVEGDLARHVADGEAPDDAVARLVELLDALAPKTERGKPLHVEEVGGAEVRVPIRYAGVQARRVDRDVRDRAGDVTVIDLDRAGVFREAASNLRDHHVPDREVDARVGGVDVPVVRRHGDRPPLGKE